MFLRFVAVLLVTLVAVVAASAQPYDPKAVFYSDNVLRRALADIAQMQDSELRSFTHYLAECQETADAVSKHFCAAAQAAYRIEFGTKRALDDMIVARSILDQLSQTTPDPDLKDPVKVANAAIKISRILMSLEQAAADRFRELKATRK